mgnify:CR=1 FL=1
MADISTTIRRTPAGRWLASKGYGDDLSQEVRLALWKRGVTEGPLARTIAHGVAVDMVRYLARRQHEDASSLLLAQEDDLAHQMDVAARLATIPERIKAIGEKIVARQALTGAERVAIMRFRHSQ